MAVEEKGIEPHAPVWEKSQRNDDTFSRADFTFDKNRNEYVCPAGKRLHPTNKITSDDTIFSVVDEKLMVAIGMLRFQLNEIWQYCSNHF